MSLTNYTWHAAGALVAVAVFVTVPASVVSATNYCPESDWSAFYDDTVGIPGMGSCNDESEPDYAGGRVVSYWAVLASHHYDSM